MIEPVCATLIPSRSCLLVALAGISLAGHLALAQNALPQPGVKSARAQPLVFEVATIRLVRERQGSGFRMLPDGISAKGAPLKWLIRSAYNENRDAMWSGEP